jgi:transposase
LRASISRTAPSKCSTAGRQRLGGISRAGDERLRQLLVLEATAVIQYTKPGRPATSPWLLNLLSRKPRKLAAVGLAIKTARYRVGHDDERAGLPAAAGRRLTAR